MLGKRKSVASRGSESDIFSLNSENSNSFVNSITVNSKPSSATKDKRGVKTVRCKGCLLKKSQLKNLKRHFSEKHPDLFKGNERKRREWFSASPDQTVAEDPAYHISRVEEKSMIEEKVEDPHISKRQKLNFEDNCAKFVEFENLFNSAFEKDEAQMS